MKNIKNTFKKIKFDDKDIKVIFEMPLLDNEEKNDKIIKEVNSIMNNELLLQMNKKE